VSGEIVSVEYITSKLSVRVKSQEILLGHHELRSHGPDQLALTLTDLKKEILIQLQATLGSGLS
jgi:hypothetical protein